MKTRMAEWLGKARQIEAAIEARVEGAPRQPDVATRQPLETVHALVASVAREAQAAGRGRQVFPYTQLRVWLAAPTARARARLTAACEGPPSLEERIVERLAAAGCEVRTLPVRISFATEPRPDWLETDYHVEYMRTAAVVSEPAAPRRLVLTVTHGTAERTSYTFAGTAVAIGRGSDVRDGRGRLIRTNHVAFVEGGGEVNQSVSRRHARIEPDAASGAFRLFDDGAAQGTSVIRDGRGLPVPRGRGLRLKSGDVLVLGDARVSVKVST